LVIIGYGNPLRGDDGIGWHAANTLATHYDTLAMTDGFDRTDEGELSLLPQAVNVIVCHQLMPELAATIATAAVVVFLDATYGNGEEPGFISQQCVVQHMSGKGGTDGTHATAQPTETLGAFTHHVTPLGLLQWTQWLYGTTPHAIVYTVTGDSFDISDTLSPAVQRAFPSLVQTIMQYVAQYMT
jgi:hydrogenase maturation protease